ncbi:hypothetical protein PTKIN_Ptkin16aG0028200 [Pterospermum kingtungense]
MDYKVPKKNWDELPSEIMEVIVERLSVPDRIRMSPVSKYWGAISSQKHIPTAPQIPWRILLYSGITDLRFFDMSVRKHITLNLPKRLQRTVCCGSSKGWLAMVDLLLRSSKPKPYQSDMFLFNPVSGEMHKLPSLSTIPCYQEFIKEAEKRGKGSTNMSFVQRIELSSAKVSECIVAGAFKPSNTTSTIVAICKPRSWRWTIFDSKSEDENFRFIDFLFNKSQVLHVMGTAKHIENYNLKLAAENYSYNLNLAAGCEVKLKIIPCAHRRFEVGTELEKLYYELYLVESTSNEILLIKKFHDRSVTKSFYLFKMDSRTGLWRRLYNIDDQVLFISSRGSESVSAKDFARFKGNCIHFAEDAEYRRVIEKQWFEIFSRDSGVFYLEDGRIEKSLHSAGSPLISSVRWFTPIL